MKLVHQQWLTAARSEKAPRETMLRWYEVRVNAGVGDDTGARLKAADFDRAVNSEAPKPVHCHPPLRPSPRALGAPTPEAGGGHGTREPWHADPAPVAEKKTHRWKMELMHIPLPSNDIGPRIGLSEHNELINNGGMLNIHPNIADIGYAYAAPNRDRNTLTRNSTGPILDTVSYERPLFAGSVANRASSHNTSHQPSGLQPRTFNDLPQGMVNNDGILHEDNLSIPLLGLIANEYSSGDYSMSPISIPPASTENLFDLQGIIDYYSTVDLPPPSYSLPDIQDSATVAAASKAAIPVSTPCAGSSRNGGPSMQNHTITRIPSRCPSKEYHELSLGNKPCSCGLSRPSKVEKGFMCTECSGVAFTTRKNGMRHARNAKKIHECPTCHEYFARIDYRNSHKKFCSGKRGQGFSRGV
ncbi:hypothetical protein BU17DRAFT_66867 [Hysterangium stoloniferum]|nr:hypothetical protein BU17DRAFT_66867 [Hysterangium stoloniferum]